MKLWKEILIQYTLIIVIYNIIVDTKNYGSADTYICLVFSMTLYMAVILAYTKSINHTDRTALNKSVLKFLLPFFWGCYTLLPMETSSIYKSLMFFIPGCVSLVINLYLVHKQHKESNQ